MEAKRNSSTQGKPDRRVIKTKQAIKDAFEELITERDYDKITVSALAERADVNRKTFYLHYSSVDALLDEMAEEHAQASLGYIREQGILDEQPLDLDKVAKGLGETYRHARLFNPLFMRKLPIGRLIAVITPTWVKLMERERRQRGLADIPERKLTYMAYFMLGGMFTAYEAWYNAGDDMQFNEIAAIVALPLVQGINGLLAPGT